jgi:hypothetical protein
MYHMLALSDGSKVEVFQHTGTLTQLCALTLAMLMHTASILPMLSDYVA